MTMYAYWLILAGAYASSYATKIVVRGRKASQAKVAQELPSNPSGAVTRGLPGENAVTGRREYVSYTKNTKQMILT